MKIGIMAIHFARGQVASSEPHLVNLVNNIVRLDHVNQYTLFVRADNVSCFELDAPNIEAVIFPDLCRYIGFRIFCEQIVVPLIALTRRLDVLHFNSNVGPALLSCASVGTIHWTPDPLTMARSPWYKRIYFALLFKWSVTKADKLIAVSQSCKIEAIKTLKVDESRIDIVPHGVSTNFQARQGQGEIANFRARYCLPDNYLLCVTSSEPYKSLPVTLEAFEKSKTIYHIQERLVLVGNIHPGEFTEMKKRIAPDFPWQDEVILTGYLPYEEIPAIYQGATALIYHSLRETFGIPLLEAMASGVPVIISNIPALTEVAGDAALVVESNNVEQLSDAIYSVIALQDLSREMSRKGLERACEYTWERAAQDTIRVYETAACSN